jgi:hypothetical protein
MAQFYVVYSESENSGRKKEKIVFFSEYDKGVVPRRLFIPALQ